MENSDAVLKQLKAIKILLLIIAVSVFSAVFSVTYITYMSSQLINDGLSESCDGQSNFNKEARLLVDAGKLDEAISLSSAQIQAKPNDPYGYWYRGLAYYNKEIWDLAIKDFERTEKLSPKWKDEYTGAYIKEAKEQMAKGFQLEKIAN